MKVILIIFALYFTMLTTFASSRQYAEKVYQEQWCNAHGGAMEVILPDKARIDCLTSTHAIEFDFANKWGESIGQSLYYSAATNKKAGIVLIMENGIKDQKYLERINIVAKKYNITVWTMTPYDLKKKGPCLAGNDAI